MATAVKQRIERVAFTLPRVELAAILARVGAIHRTSGLPVLQSVLVQAKAGKLTFTYTDIDRVVEARTTADCEGDAALCIPFKRLYDIVRALPSDADVTLTLSAKSAVVTAGRSRFEIASIPAGEFPQIEEIKKTKTASLLGRELAAAIGRVAGHVASAETAGANRALCGMLVEMPEKGPHHLVAATRYGMARVGIGTQSGLAPLTGNFVVPRESLTAIVKLFAESEQVNLTGNQQKLVLWDDATTLTVSLLVEKFPAYMQMVNGFKPKHSVEIDRLALEDSLKRVGTLADGLAVRMAFTKDEVTLRVRTVDVGNGSDVLPCSFDGPADFAIRFNPRYVLDCLGVIGGERVRIEFQNPEAVVRFTGAAKADGPFSMLATLRAIGDE